MLTDRQIHRMQRDADDAERNEASTDGVIILARHVQDLLGEVARLRQWDQDRWLLDKWKEQNGTQGT